MLKLSKVLLKKFLHAQELYQINLVLIIKLNLFWEIKVKKINLEQKTKAESDIAVAAASIIARAKFVYTLKMMEKEYSISIPKGCSDKVKETASELINAHGPKILTKIAKCHFKTTDAILHSSGFCRNDLIKD